MDCRKYLLLCLGLLVPLSGCVTPFTALRWADDSEQTGEKIAKKPESYVSFGNFRAGASFAPETPADARQGYREEARLSYQKAIEIDPKHVPAYLALARLQQACQDNTAALATYQKALKITARDATVYYELAMCQARQKMFAEAVGSLKKACELNPGNKKYREDLGYTLARAGRWNESLAQLTGVIGPAQAYYCLARMLDHVNQPGMARQYLAAALERDPNLAGARELFAKLEGLAPAPAPRSASSVVPATGPVPSRVQMPITVGASVRATVVEVPPQEMPCADANRIRLPPQPVIRIRPVDE